MIDFLPVSVGQPARPVAVAPLLVTIASLLVAFAGCTSDSVPVAGSVSSGSGAVEGATVAFYDATGAPAATVVTDAAGQFALANLPAGNYGVAVYFQREEEVDPYADVDAAANDPQPAARPQRPDAGIALDPKYESPFTSGLEASVAPGAANRFDWKLE